MDQSPIHHQHSPPSNHHSLSNAALTEIQLELELLKERRRALEQQRRLLLEAPPAPPTAASHAAAGHPNSSFNTSGAAGQRGSSPSSARSQSTNRSRSGPTGRSRSETGRSVSAMNHHRVLPSEKQRRDQLQPNIYQQMKEAMRRSWDHDSTLVGGCFNVRDNPQNSTFGRERRFLPVNGTKGTYFLATDVQHMQQSAKEGRQRHLTASSRGGPGCNVQSNWNDSRGGAAPGPGAYTPRYQKLAKPSILTQR